MPHSPQVISLETYKGCFIIYRWFLEQSRAVYAADVMLAWEGEEGARKVQPKLLEINWMPDCQRACVYYPSFFDDIFSTLFLGQRKNVISL